MMAALLSLLVVGSALTACAGDQASRSTVQVPVLWVKVGEDGPSGGVSTAQVTVSLTGSDSSSSVDLHASQGADTGDSWDAAAAMASTVAVLYSGQDPRGVHTQVGVSDAIDGSSAGGVLTVAVLAALRHAPINPKVAMTGSISPDGSIGPVDGIEAKVRAAASGGFTTILVPAASVQHSAAATSPTSSPPPTTATAPSSPSAASATPSPAAPSASSATTSSGAGAASSGSNGLVDTDALAAELGVTVTPVQDVGEAMMAFTRETVAPSAAPMPALTPEAQQVLRSQAARAVTLATSQLRANRGGIGAVAAQQAATNLAQAARQLAARDQASAYATAIGTTIVLDQAIAKSATTTASAKNAQAASQAVLTDAEMLVSQARSKLRQQTDNGSSGDPVRRYATVSAMTWLTRTIAVVQAVAQELAALNGEVADSIVEAATVIAQYRVYADVIYPDSLAVAQLHTLDPPADRQGVESFIAAYTDLLAATGAANQRYYEKVLTSIADNPGLTFSQPGHIYAAVQQLQIMAMPASSATSASAPATSASTLGATAPPPPSPVVPTSAASARPPTDEACAWAMSYFLMSSFLVAADQSFGLNGSGIGSLVLSSQKPVALRAAFLSADEATSAFAANLGANGVLTDHPVWTADWARRLPGAFTGQAVGTGMTSVGLTVLWDAAVESFMNTASLDAKARSG